MYLKTALVSYAFMHYNCIYGKWHKKNIYMSIRYCTRSLFALSCIKKYLLKRLIYGSTVLFLNIILSKITTFSNYRMRVIFNDFNFALIEYMYSYLPLALNG